MITLVKTFPRLILFALAIAMVLAIYLVVPRTAHGAIMFAIQRPYNTPQSLVKQVNLATTTATTTRPSLHLYAY